MTRSQSVLRTGAVRFRVDVVPRTGVLARNQATVAVNNAPVRRLVPEPKPEDKKEEKPGEDMGREAVPEQLGFPNVEPQANNPAVNNPAAVNPQGDIVNLMKDFMDGRGEEALGEPTTLFGVDLSNPAVITGALAAAGAGLLIGGYLTKKALEKKPEQKGRDKAKDWLDRQYFDLAQNSWAALSWGVLFGMALLSAYGLDGHWLVMGISIVLGAGSAFYGLRSLGGIALLFARLMSGLDRLGKTPDEKLTDLNVFARFGKWLGIEYQDNETLKLR
jgi:hypothetical protein